MNYTDPELRDRLAAEYALGTLRGPARRRFEQLMSNDPSLGKLTQGWERRLGPLAEAIPAVKPPARLWEGVAGRLQLAPAPRSEGWHRRLWASTEFWRGASLLAAAASVAAVYVAVQRPAGVDREQLAALDQRLARIEDAVQRSAVAPEGMDALNDRLAGIETRLKATVPQPSHVAVLIDKYARPMMTANLDVADGRLMLELHITPPRDFTGKTLEVWWTPPGGTLRTLGLLPSGKGGTSTVLALPQDVAASLAASSLLVSLEPSGGSTEARPTGPVLFSGSLVPIDL